MRFLDIINEKIMHYAIGNAYKYVKFADNKAFKDWFASLSPDMQNNVKSFIDNDYNIIIKTHTLTDDHYLISQELSPSFFTNDLRVPQSVVELTGHSMTNPPPHPKSWYYDSKETLKPVEAKDYLKNLSDEADNQTNKTNQPDKKGKAKYKKSVR